MRTFKGRPDWTQGMAAWSPGNLRVIKTPVRKLPFLEWRDQRKRNIKSDMHEIFIIPITQGIN